MKIIYIFLLLNTFIFALFADNPNDIDNPHEINIVGKNINSNMCKSCHLSFKGNYSGYFASIYTPSMNEYRTYLASNEYLTYLAFIDNSSINDIKTAGSDSQTSDNSNTNPWSLSSSMLCMSCHDGAIALAISHKATLKISLDKSHPISIDYTEGKSGLKDKNTKIYDWNNATFINDILVNDKIECVSCHSPHSKTYKNYLRSTNTGSKLCFACHDK